MQEARGEKDNFSADESITLDAIINECKDAPGYVIFVGVLDKKFNKDGKRSISFKYRRYQYSFEDTKMATEHFIQAYKDDLKEADL